VAARKKIGSDLFDPIERPLYGAPNSTGSIEFGELPPRDLSPPVFAPPCAACQFFLPFRLLLACPVAFKFPLLGWPTLITIREERQAAFDKRMPILKADGIDLLRDRAGVIRYSDVEVQFPYALLRDTRVAALVGFAVVEEPPDRTTEWLESLHPDVNKVSIFAVNRLLRAYRFLSGEHWVRSIGATDIFYIQTGWLFPDAPSPFAMTLGTPGQSIVPEARPLSDRFHGELARWLGAERDVPIWVELVQDAREHLEVGRLRHVVIDTRTALEVYVDQTLLACFRQRALSPRDAAKELKLSKMSAQSASSLEEAIRLASINDKLKRGVKKALGIELGRLKVWGDWLAAKDVREGSVHYGQDVSETDARRCLEVVEALINAIHEAGSPVSAALKPATSS
jgi:hypothetical protein